MKHMSLPPVRKPLQRVAQRVDNVLGPWLGQDLFAAEWDVAVILDGCRAEAYRQWYPTADAVWSPAACSPAWLRRTFDTSHANVGYVGGNPYAPKIVSRSVGWFRHVPPCRVRGVETSPPTDIVDAAAWAWANADVDRVVAHLMQPHVPFPRRKQWFSDGDGWGAEMWRQAATGAIDLSAWWESYHAGLAWGLAAVNRLRHRLPEGVQVLVTADHGNSVSRLAPGHPDGSPLPTTRRVPWHYRPATGGTAPPSTLPATVVNPEPTVDRAQLRALGYT